MKILRTRTVTYMYIAGPSEVASTHVHVCGCGCTSPRAAGAGRGSGGGGRGRGQTSCTQTIEFNFVLQMYSLYIVHGNILKVQLG